MNREEILQLLQENVSYLALEFGVTKTGLFGSYTKGPPDETSDIDVVVEFERPIGLRFLELAEFLETLLGRKVDLLTPAGIQNIRKSHALPRNARTSSSKLPGQVLCGFADNLEVANHSILSFGIGRIRMIIQVGNISHNPVNSYSYVTQKVSIRPLRHTLCFRQCYWRHGLFRMF